MTLKEHWKEYQFYTQELTNHERKLGFAGSAICWFFKNPDTTFPFTIYISLAFFVAFFIADVCQYLMGALTLKAFLEEQEIRLHEKTGSIEGEIDKPRTLDEPGFKLFKLKALFLVIAFAFIGIYVLEQLWKAFY